MTMYPNEAAEQARLAFGEAWDDLDPLRRGQMMRQLLWDIVDRVEQSDEEPAWASLAQTVDAMTHQGTRPAEVLPPLSTVWVVWSDVCGDDCPDVEAIFTSKAQADAYAFGIGAHVEEAGIDDKTPGPPGTKAFDVRCEIDKIAAVHLIRKQPGEPRLPAPQRLVVEVWARDHEHAKQVVMERFPMVKARESAK